MCNVWGLERSQFTTHLITRLTQGLEMTVKETKYVHENPMRICSYPCEH